MPLATDTLLFWLKQRPWTWQSHSGAQRPAPSQVSEASKAVHKQVNIKEGWKLGVILATL